MNGNLPLPPKKKTKQNKPKQNKHTKTVTYNCILGLLK